jgi:hypothetical protein
VERKEEQATPSPTVEGEGGGDAAAVKLVGTGGKEGRGVEGDVRKPWEASVSPETACNSPDLGWSL